MSAINQIKSMNTITYNYINKLELYKELIELFPKETFPNRRIDIYKEGEGEETLYKVDGGQLHFQSLGKNIIYTINIQGHSFDILDSNKYHLYSGGGIKNFIKVISIFLDKHLI